MTTVFLQIIGFIFFICYILPWLALTLFYPFLTGFKSYVLSVVTKQLQDIYNIESNGDVKITLLQLICTSFTALATFSLTALNRYYLNKRHRAYCNWLLLVAFAFLQPIFLWLANRDLQAASNYDSHQLHFWLFGLFVGLSGLGDAAFSSFSDVTIRFFYKKDHRLARILLSQIAEGFGMALVFRNAGNDNDNNNETVNHDDNNNIVYLLTLLFLIAAIVLSVAIFHNILTRFTTSNQFRWFPTFFTKCCLNNDEEEEDDDKSSKTTCLLPLYKEKDDEIEMKKPSNFSTRKLQFNALTLSKALSLFVKNAFIWWAMKYYGETVPDDWAGIGYMFVIATGCLLGTFLATIFLKMYLDKKMSINLTVVYIIGAFLIATTLFLGLSLIMPLIISNSTFLLCCPAIAAYVTTMTMTQIVIDDVQHRLVPPQLRGLGFSGGHVFQEIGKSTGPFFIDGLKELSGGLQIPMICLLIPSLATLVPLSAFALRRRKRQQPPVAVTLKKINEEKKITNNADDEF